MRAHLLQWSVQPSVASAQPWRFSEPSRVRCAGCLTQWLRMHGSGRKCPVCREDLSALARTLSSALRRPEGDGHEAEEEAE